MEEVISYLIGWVLPVVGAMIIAGVVISMYCRLMSEIRELRRLLLGIADGEPLPPILRPGDSGRASRLPRLWRGLGRER